MKQRLGRGPLALMLLMLSLASSIVFAEPNDPELGWADTKTNFNLIHVYASGIYPCTASEANFLSCVHLVNGIGQNAVPPQALIPADMPAKTPGMKAQVIRTFDKGKLVLAQVDSWGAEPQTTRQRGEQLKTKETSLKDAAFADFKSSTKIDFIELAKELLAKKKANISLQRAIATGVNEMILVHDGHGHLEPHDYYMKGLRDADENFFGVGLFLSSTGKTTFIEGAIDGSPAQKVDLKRKDMILSVDDKDVTDTSLDDLVSMIRGPENTTVKLTVKRKDKIIPVEIKRGAIHVPNVNVKERNAFGRKILHIKINRFDELACEKVEAALQDFKSKAQGIVLDLRNNPGGLVDTAVCIGGLFVGKKVIVRKRLVEDGETTDVLESRISEKDQLTDLPLVVLINERSASASEITSGAMQDYKRGLILGTRSYGKATVQEGRQYDLANDLMIFETIARFYTPSDRTNQIVGIQPDIEVFERPNMTEDEKYALREAELVPAALPPAGVQWVQPRPDEIEKVKRECLTGRSETLLPILDQSEEPADYQLLKAEEVLSCSAGQAAAVMPPDSNPAKEI